MSAAFGRLCVETQPFGRRRPNVFQPPSGGCVLKHGLKASKHGLLIQPPSGGCVLKRLCIDRGRLYNAAAFGRLCVETPLCTTPAASWTPAAFGRLCVETGVLIWMALFVHQPPSGGCVLKHIRGHLITGTLLQPPSGGCVLKL